jgi:hypothetical protein
MLIGTPYLPAYSPIEIMAVATHTNRTPAIFSDKTAK